MTNTVMVQAQDTGAADTASWMTKDEAARALNVSTKTIEKYVKQGRLRQEMQNQVNKPARAVIQPEGVRQMQEKATKDLHAQAWHDRLAGRSSGMSGWEPNLGPSMPLTEIVPHRTEKLLEVLLGKTRELPPSELTHRTVLTLDEASRLTGFGKAYLEERVKFAKIGPRGARVCRKVDLNDLWGEG